MDEHDAPAGTSGAPAGENRARAGEDNPRAGLPNPAPGVPGLASPGRAKRGTLRPAAWLCAIVGLLAVGALAFLWASRLDDSLNAYQSPIQKSLLVGRRLAPLTDGLVLFIVDGLRYDAATGMAVLNDLAAGGADAVVEGVAPSYSETTWTTLVTGASAQLSGAPVFNETYETLRPIGADHLFAAAKEAGRTTAAAGSDWWEKMIPASQRGAGAFTPGSDAPADAAIVDVAVSWLDSPEPPAFLLIHVSNVDLVGEAHGTAGSEYRMAAMQVEDYLRQVVAMMDLSRQTLVVVTDHGQIGKGGHGGAEPASVKTRLVAVGKGIVPGSTDTLRQVDIAPTLAALLGCRVPASNEGQFAEALLDWGDEARARAWVALAQSRLGLTAAYLNGIGAPAAVGEPAMSRTLVLGDLLAVDAWDEALRLARSFVQEMDAERATARLGRLDRERLARSWLPVAYLSLLGALFWRSRRGDWPVLIGPALLAIGLYHALFLLGRNTYSYSMVVSESQLLLGVAGRTLAGLLLAWLELMIAGRARERSLHPQMQAADRAHLRVRTPQSAWQTLRFGWLVIALLGLPIVGIAWWQGPAVSWTLPNFDAVFVLLMTLIQALMVAGGTLLLAGAALIYDLVR